MLKTHNCGEVRLPDVGQTVNLAGWLQRRRDHGGLIFIDLRDRSGLVQVTADPTVGEAYGVAEKARGEYVLQVTGRVRPRPEGTVNPNLASGEIEVLAQSIEILNTAKTVPIPIDDDGYKTDETLRLKYRYLDLAPRAPAEELDPAPQGDQVHARLPGRAGLHRDRNADADQVHAGRRARLCGAVPGAAAASFTRCRKARSSSSNC